MRTVHSDPRASVLIESMRDIGYTLETALADIIDNSITASATTIHILANTPGPSPSIGILDDGEGMTEAELFAAMRLGSRSPREDRASTDLGRFGLGLKTASFSQCRRLTVVSRKEGATAAARWDLDRVVAEDEWLLEVPEGLGEIPFSSQLGERGTLVVWEVLDRIVERDGTERDAAHFAQRLDSARAHLELVFHRFLSGEPGLQKVRILLNERPLEAFDPFNRNSLATIQGPLEMIKVGVDKVSVQAFTLPHHQKVSQDEWERYAGPNGYLRSQGFYLYRGRRLIIHGTWFGLARQMELTKLARVRIDIPNGLDAAWKIDVLKASAQLPYQVKDRLRRIIEELGGTSKRVYTSRGRRLASDSRLPMWNRLQSKNEITYELNREHPLLATFVARLPDDLMGDFLKIIELVGATIPVDALYADMGNDPEKVSGNHVADQTLGLAVETAYHELERTGLDRASIVELLTYAEPFRSNWSRTEVILRDIPDMQENHV